MSDTPSTPDWIKEAKASRDQLEYAFEVATETVNRAHRRYQDAASQRCCMIEGILPSMPAGSDVTAYEGAILVTQRDVYAAAIALESAMRDQLALRSELMGIKS